MTQTRDQSSALRRGGIAAQDVRAFLLAHPELFSNDAEVLASLQPTAAPAGNVVDMQSFVIRRLREEMQLIRAQGQALIEAAASNLLAQERVHGAVLQIMQARSFGHLIRIVSHDVGPMIGAEAVLVCIEAPRKQDLPHSPPSGILVLPPGGVDDVLGPEIHHLLNAGRKRMPGLYGRQSRRVRSEAMIRLNFGHDTPPGLLVLGSFAPETFAPDQRTELLCFLANAVERAMCSWLGLGEE